MTQTTDRAEVGKQLQTRRKNLGLSRSALAKLLGVDYSHLYRVETYPERYFLSQLMIKKIEDVFAEIENGKAVIANPAEIPADEFLLELVRRIQAREFTPLQMRLIRGIAENIVSSDGKEQKQS